MAGLPPSPCAHPIPASAGTPLRPAAAGVGLKPEHYGDVLAGAGRSLWFEIHPENYMGAGGPPHRYLEAIRRDHALSLHAVGLSLGSADGLEPAHVARLRRLVDRYQPALLSDHLSWSAYGAHSVHDLLPLPMTRAALDCLADNIDRAHELLGRRLLIENPSLYLAPAGAEMDEPAFMAALCRRTGCGWLLDINNVAVSAANLGFDAAAYIDAVDPALVGEIHLAGHACEHHPDGDLLIDDHGSAVPSSVWTLYRRFIARAGSRPTLVEWDTNLPPFAALADQAARARAILDTAPAAVAAITRTAGHDRAA